MVWSTTAPAARSPPTQGARAAIRYGSPPPFASGGPTIIPQEEARVAGQGVEPHGAGRAESADPGSEGGDPVRLAADVRQRRHEIHRRAGRPQRPGAGGPGAPPPAPRGG